MRHRGLYQEVGRRVRVARENATLRQEALAEAIGLTRSSVTNIESGTQQLPLHVLASIANVLEVPLTSLIPDDLPAPTPVAKLPDDVPPKAAAVLNRLARSGWR